MCVAEIATKEDFLTLSPCNRSDTAILYNDRSVLENHHISAVFRMMQDDDMNILVNLTKDEFA